MRLLFNCSGDSLHNIRNFRHNIPNFDWFYKKQGLKSTNLTSKLGVFYV